MLFKNKYPKLLGSSVDPYKLSLTIKGVLKTVAAVVLALAPFMNIGTDEINAVLDSLDAFLSGLDSLLVAALALWGAGEAVVGAVRKLAVSFKIIKVN